MLFLNLSFFTLTPTSTKTYAPSKIETLQRRRNACCDILLPSQSSNCDVYNLLGPVFTKVFSYSIICDVSGKCMPIRRCHLVQTLSQLVITIGLNVRTYPESVKLKCKATISVRSGVSKRRNRAKPSETGFLIKKYAIDCK